MRCITFRQAWALLLAATLVGAGSGCFTPYGFVLRGDWSIEANRVPFLASNGPVYQSVGCTTTKHECGPAGCPLKSCNSGAGANPHEAPSMPAGPRKFHPVPTKPVFEPPADHRGNAAPPATCAPVEEVEINTLESLPAVPEAAPQPVTPDQSGAELIEPRTGSQVKFTVRPSNKPGWQTKPASHTR